MKKTALIALILSGFVLGACASHEHSKASVPASPQKQVQGMIEELEALEKDNLTPKYAQSSEGIN